MTDNNETQAGVLGHTERSSGSMMMALELALEEINTHVKYVLCIFLLCATGGVFNAWHIIVSNFNAFVPPHWCRVAELEEAGWTTQQIRAVSAPNITDVSSCSMIAWNYTMFAQLGYDETLGFIANSSSHPKKIPCSEFFYDEKIPHSTVVAEWDLVCEKKVQKSNVQGAIAFGKFFGGFLFGFVSDLFGRKPTFVVCCLIYFFFGVSSALTGSFWVFLVTRFFTGVAGSGCYECGFTILAEFVSKKHRAQLGCIFNLGYPLGYITLPGLSFIFPEWRHLQLSISLPMAIFLLHFWLLPESPRWLLIHGCPDKAWKIIKKFNKDYEVFRPNNSDEAAPQISQAARKTLDRVDQAADQYIPGFSAQVKQVIESSNVEAQRTVHSSLESDTRKVSVYSACTGMLKEIFLIFSTRELCKRITISIFNFIVASLIYYVLALNAKNFNLDQHLYTFVSGWIEIPGYISPLCILLYLGRKGASSLLFLSSGLSLLLIAAVPRGQKYIILAVAMFGRFTDVAVFALVTVYCAELFPTVVRNSAIGISLAMSQLGSIYAPYIDDLLSHYGWYIPTTICGIFALLASVFILMLPETRGKHLPNTVDDVSDQTDKVSIRNCCQFS